MDNIEDKYNAALAHIEELKQEITRLRSLLELPVNENIATTDDQIASYSTFPARVSTEPTIGESNIHQYSTVEDKLALYKSYFRGRDDVYPVRWGNKQGKSGYSPACGNVGHLSARNPESNALYAHIRASCPLQTKCYQPI
ncbi:hypothetical protein PaeBR_00955 [Paenibacillus sp. BR2-3]|uniref:TOTE conflict system archaeo-eukaryotic primase domain-containing protein n=1 Tax=Paenibacillus sp. BR2-3 TaxID=3048494 RepID=UPI003977A32A